VVNPSPDAVVRCFALVTDPYYVKCFGNHGLGFLIQGWVLCLFPQGFCLRQKIT